MKPVLDDALTHSLVVSEVPAPHALNGRIHSIRDVGWQAREPILEWGAPVFKYK